MTESYTFQAEINQLLSLIINAFYSDNDVFLRELVSNASDALVKHKYNMLQSNTSIDEDLHILVTPDKDQNTLSIEDNGLGMTKEELVKNLGMIAHSSTSHFIDAMKQAKDTSGDSKLIGQFGMGFYSAFLVAKTVEVFSRSSENDPVFIWESDASGSFTVRQCDNDCIKRGTRIVLHLKEDQSQYLSEHVLKTILTKHSNYIAFPVKLYVEKEVDEVNDTDTKFDKEGVEDIEVQKDIEDRKPKKKLVKEYEQTNDATAIWARKNQETTEEEYNEFYKKLSGDWDVPLCTKHFDAEGQFKFTGLLYIPKYPPVNPEKNKNNIKLYVNRVFITDSCENIVPEYLGFVRGVIDSEDLPLNVSREMLQKSKVLYTIKKTVVKKVFEVITDLMGKPEDYKTFWDHFGRHIKWGITEDTTNKNKLLDFVRFKSNKGDHVSLNEYLQRMKEGQKNVYYIVGESIQAVENSVFVEKLKEKDYEIMYMTDAIDEYMMQGLYDYKDMRFVCVTKDTFDLDDTVENNEDQLCDVVKNVLGSLVTKVKVSSRLVDSPCVVVTENYGTSANMERILKAQAIQGGMPTMASPKVFEMNPAHPLIQELKGEINSDKEMSASGKEKITMLYQLSLLSSGFSVDNIKDLTTKVYTLMMEKK